MTTKPQSEFVWYKGKCWYNPNNPVTAKGEISLWSLLSDGLGIVAPVADVRECTKEQTEAISYFLQRTRNPDFVRLQQAVIEQIEFFEKTPDDPYNIHNAVILALRSIQAALEKANRY